jgi:hypothetical protein
MWLRRKISQRPYTVKRSSCNSMELSPSRRLLSYSRISQYLWKLNVHYSFGKSLPMAPILIQINPVHSTQIISLNYILTLSCHTRLGLPSVLFPLGFSTSRDSVVVIATGYWLGDRRIGVWVPVGSRIFSSPPRPDRLCGPPNHLSNGYRGLFARE